MSYHEDFESEDGIISYDEWKRRAHHGVYPEPEKESCGRGHSKPCCTFTGGGDADEETHD